MLTYIKGFFFIDILRHLLTGWYLLSLTLKMHKQNDYPIKKSIKSHKVICDDTTADERAAQFDI